MFRAWFMRREIMGHGLGAGRNRCGIVWWLMDFLGFLGRGGGELSSFSLGRKKGRGQNKDTIPPRKGEAVHEGGGTRGGNYVLCPCNFGPCNFDGVEARVFRDARGVRIGHRRCCDGGGGLASYLASGFSLLSCEQAARARTRVAVKGQRCVFIGITLPLSAPPIAASGGPSRTRTPSRRQARRSTEWRSSHGACPRRCAHKGPK